ncbi:MAG: SDR family oxidoreductase [Bacteroidales bacterium]|nr:SDR family oxidoreductase [Bacteroidales bacterium]
MTTPYTLVDKNILITGASSGIGRAIAILCSRMGAKCCITGRNAERLEDTLSQMQGDGHQAIVADLLNEEDRAVLVNALPKLDGVVQNAGVGSRVPCKFVTQTDIDQVFTINTFSPILLQKELMQGKKLSAGASVVFISSMAVKYPSVGNAIYSASKGAIQAYAQVLALELAPRKIRVNCVCPAMIWTDLVTADGIDKDDLIKDQAKYPLGRYGSPEDVADLVGFILSPASSWMTGSCVELTGGGNEL